MYHARNIHIFLNENVYIGREDRLTENIKMKELFLIDRMSINGRTSNESILSKTLDIGKLMVEAKREKSQR